MALHKKLVGQAVVSIDVALYQEIVLVGYGRDAFIWKLSPTSTFEEHSHTVGAVQEKQGLPSTFVPESYDPAHDDLISSVKITGNDLSNVAAFATGSRDHTIKLWNKSLDEHTYQPFDSKIVCSETLKGHTGSVTSLAFVDDARYLVSSSADTSVIIWDMPTVTGTWGIKRSFKHKEAVSDVTTDARHIVYSSSLRTVRTWDLNTEKRTGKLIFNTTVNCLENRPFSSGQLAVGLADGTVAVHDNRAPDSPSVWNAFVWNIGAEILSVKWDPYDTSKLVTTDGRVCKIVDIRLANHIECDLGGDSYNCAVFSDGLVIAGDKDSVISKRL